MTFDQIHFVLNLFVLILNFLGFGSFGWLLILKVKVVRCEMWWWWVSEWCAIKIFNAKTFKNSKSRTIALQIFSGFFMLSSLFLVFNNSFFLYLSVNNGKYLTKLNRINCHNVNAYAQKTSLTFKYLKRLLF